MKKHFSEWKTLLLTTPAIIIIFALFRLINLHILPVFADEAIYVRWAQIMKAEATLRFLPLSDGKQPLFMWSIIPFLKIINDPLIAGRLVSVLSGLGSLVGIGVLTYLLFKNKMASAFAMLIYAVSPFAVFFDRMALVDSMLTMFGIWTFVFAYLTAKYIRLDTAMLAGFALGGALLTKSPAIFFALLLPATAIFCDWGNKKKTPLQLIKLASLWVVTWVIGFAMYNILRLGPNFHLISSRNEDYIFPLTHILENPKDPFLPHFDRALEWITTMGTSLILLFFIMGTALNFSKFKKEILFLLVWAFLPILVQAEYAKVFTARYILFTIPPLMIISATSLIPLVNKNNKPFFKKVVTPVLVALFLFQACLFNFKLITNPEASPLPRSERSGYLEEWTAGTGIKEISEFLLNEVKQNPDKNYVVGTEGFFGTLPDGLQIYTQNIDRLTVIGVGLGIKEPPVQLVESFESGNKTYLVINSSRIQIKEFKDCYNKMFYPETEAKHCDLSKILEEYGYKIMLSFQKANRPDFVREFFHHGRYDTLYLLEVVNISNNETN